MGKQGALGRISTVIAAALLMSACQSTNAADFEADQDCLQRKVGSKVLSRLAGFGLAAAGIPGGGIAARGVSLATDPRCQAFRLTPEARERIRREGPAVPERPRETLHNLHAGG